MDTILRGKKILWVEDDKFLNDIISKKMLLQEATLIHANTGEEALALLDKDIPDVIVLDILLPGISGLDVLEKVKKNGKTGYIPVILLTNLGARADMEKGKRLGAVRFLVKAMTSLDDTFIEIEKVLQETEAQKV